MSHNKLNFLSLYLRDFNRDYLSTREDRRQALHDLLAFLATVALIAVCALLAW